MTRSQVFWLITALIALSGCITVGIRFGWAATGIMVAAAVFPDIALVGAFVSEGRLKPERVRFYNALHTLVGPAIVALAGAAVFALTNDSTILIISLAWFMHIAIDRACGYRLRNPDGSIQSDRTRQQISR